MTHLHLAPSFLSDGAFRLMDIVLLTYNIIRGDNSSHKYYRRATDEEIWNFKGGDNPAALEQKRHLL